MGAPWKTPRLSMKPNQSHGCTTLGNSVKSQSRLDRLLYNLLSTNKIRQYLAWCAAVRLIEFLDFRSGFGVNIAYTLFYLFKQVNILDVLRNMWSPAAIRNFRSQKYLSFFLFFILNRQMIPFLLMMKEKWNPNGKALATSTLPTF